MLDGAGASTFLDLIDERNQQFIKTKPNNTENTTENTNSDKEIPFTNIAKDKVRNDKKNVVFIDSAVEDYETITSSFKENVLISGLYVSINCSNDIIDNLLNFLKLFNSIIYYLSLSVANPTRAKIIAIIQKRITIVDSAHPFFSK